MKLKRGVAKKRNQGLSLQRVRYRGRYHNRKCVGSRLDEENANNQFWTKNDKGVIKIVHILFKQFLEENGFL